MRGLSSSISSTYPDIVIQILPPPKAQDFETRFAGWGLYKGSISIPLKNWYIETVFDLHWYDNQVASILFRSRSTLSMNQTMQSPTQASSDGSLLPLNSTSLMLSNKSQDNAIDTNDTNPYDSLPMQYLPNRKALGMKRFSPP